MKRLILAASLLSVSGLAAGQTGVEIGSGDFTVISPPILGPVFTTGVELVIPRFEPINITALANASAQPVAPPLNPGVTLHGEQALVTIEEEGIRLPDEQFTLP